MNKCMWEKVGTAFVEKMIVLLPAWLDQVRFIPIDALVRKNNKLEHSLIETSRRRSKKILEEPLTQT